MRTSIIFLLLFPLLIFAQNETRLALVIGNSNYDVGKLDNPVNDALLIAETLEKLDFDVILDTNLTHERSFKEIIREFGEKRPSYNDYLTAISLNVQDPEGYYYLALMYMNEEKSLQAIKYFGKAITKLSSGEDYYITAENGKDRIELADIYLKMAEIYKNEEDIESMCEEYNEACNLGKCEMFEKYCQ